MPYILTRYANTTLVPDNGATPIANIVLPGKNYLGYGQPVDQSLLNMVEHFAGSSEPSNPIIGQMWFDTTVPTSRVMKYNDGTQTTPNWVPLAKAGGNITADTITANNFIGNLTTSTSVLTANLTTGANNIAGTITGNWTLTAGSKLNATYADLAEKYSSDKDYPPGTLLMIGGDKEVTLATVSGKWNLAGVVTSQPAYVLNSTLSDSVTIALIGRVPCMVTGNISKGDMLTISNIDGVATTSTIKEYGTIIGRALEDYNDSNVGTIEIKVDRA
jgi:hypothetical protein